MRYAGERRTAVVLALMLAAGSCSKPLDPQDRSTQGEAQGPLIQGRLGRTSLDGTLGLITRPSRLEYGSFFRKADDSGIITRIKDQYMDDAHRLAVRHVNEVGGWQAELVWIPEFLVQPIYDGLIHIYNARGIPARDTVVFLYWRDGLHTHPSPSVYDMIARVDARHQWVDEWRKGNRLTGNPAVDFLMETYELRLGWFRMNFWPRGFVTLHSKEPLNQTALARKFERIPGVILASWGGAVGDVCCDIRWSATPGYFEYVFRLAWGYCTVGCEFERFWRMRVAYDGAVEYVDSWGDPPPRVYAMPAGNPRD